MVLCTPGLAVLRVCISRVLGYGFDKAVFILITVLGVHMTMDDTDDSALT